MDKPKIFGTKEWADKTVNCISGCEHRCRYCYASWQAARFHRCERSEWGESYYFVREKDVKKGPPNIDGGTVMFPSSHDITPKFLDSCLRVILKNLRAGNRMLIVSKPHLECIERICRECEEFKSQILFRFTVCSFNDGILKLWEPGAPSFDERRRSLQIAFENGFATSVSCEPMLDSENVVELFYRLEPFITHSFWIGKMNRIKERVYNVSDEEIQRIIDGQTDARIWEIYSSLKNEEKIRWKESFKSVLGLEMPDQPGLDI